LRVRCARNQDPNSFALTLADGTGTPIAQVDALRARPVARDFLANVMARPSDLLRLEWAPVPLTDAPDALAGRWAGLGEDPFDIAPPQTFADLDALERALSRGE